MFLSGGTSQSAKYNKKSRKSYKDIDNIVDFGRPVYIVPHMFRYSFVSVLSDKNVNLNFIREFVGHSEDSREVEKSIFMLCKKENIRLNKL